MPPIDTTEARWFLDGEVPETMEAAFRAGVPIEPEAPAARTDHYLRLPHGAGIGIKQREGRLELKWLTGTLRGCEPYCGRLTCWRKAAGSAEPAGLEIPGDDWTAVSKERLLSRTPAAAERGVRRCDVELSRLRVAGRRYWTLCIEAEGEEAGAAVRHAVGRLGKTELGPALAETPARDYPEWLRAGRF